MTTCLRGLLAVAGIAAAVPVQGRPMSIQDLIAAIRVSDPQVSRDGRMVAFVRTTTDPSSGKRNGDIWIVPADGSAAPKPLIAGTAAENTPRWSADGKSLAFISSRDGAPQVYVATADGSGVRKVTSIAAGVQPPLIWSPDGASLAFVSDVDASCADEACNAAQIAATEKDPVKVHRLTGLLYRHWDEWRDAQRHHVFVVAAAGGAARDVTPGDFDSPPTQAEDAALSFSPDGRSLLIVSNRESREKQASSTNNDVWIVPASGGAARKLTTNPAADASPAFTPDGQSIVLRSQRRAGFESDRWYLDVVDRNGGARRTIFETPDLSVSEFTLSADGRTAFFTATHQGADNLYSVPVSGGTPQLVAKGGSISSVSIGGTVAVFSRSTMLSPAEIYQAPLRGGESRALTRENEGWLKQVTFTPPESATVQSPAGPVQYWIVKPPNFDPAKKYPVVFMIHGGPQGAWDDGWSYRWNPALWAAQGWVIAAPNPAGSFGFGQPFVDAVSQDWCGRPMQDLNAVFDAVSQLSYVDAGRTAIAGASYGGYAVDWLLAQTNRFKVAVTHDGVFNLESMALATEEQWFTDWEFGGPPTSARARQHFAKCSPHRFAENIKTPTMVITNELDFRVPVDQGLQLYTVLQRQGVESEGLVFPDEGHWVLKALNSRRWHESVFDWLRRHLSDGQTTAAR